MTSSTLWLLLAIESFAYLFMCAVTAALFAQYEAKRRTLWLLAYGGRCPPPTATPLEHFVREILAPEEAAFAADVAALNGDGTTQGGRHERLA